MKKSMMKRMNIGILIILGIMKQRKTRRKQKTPVVTVTVMVLGQVILPIREGK
jgi:hypothetical protein